jgi:hypothetical protein
MLSTNGELLSTPTTLERSDAASTAVVAVLEPSLPRLLWAAWKAYTHRAAGYQTVLLMSAVYFLVLGPSAVVARLFGSQLLDLSTAPRASYWISRKPADKSVAGLQRQF